MVRQAMGFCLSCWLHLICPVHCIDFATFHWKMKFVVKKSKQEQNKKTRGYRTAQAKSSLKRKAKMIAFKKEDQKFRTTKKSWYILIQLLLHTIKIWLLLLLLVKVDCFWELEIICRNENWKNVNCCDKKTTFFETIIWWCFLFFPHTIFPPSALFYPHFSLKRA